MVSVRMRYSNNAMETNFMKTVLTFLWIFVYNLNVQATAQYPDKIIYEGGEYDLHTNPMDVYFRKHPEH